MEFKVRKESQTMVEKVFYNFEKRGYVRNHQIGPMLRALNPDLNPSDEELKQRFVEYDRDRIGALDFDSFNELALYYLLEHSRRNSDGFAHKHFIRLNDF